MRVKMASQANVIKWLTDNLSDLQEVEKENSFIFCMELADGRSQDVYLTVHEVGIQMESPFAQNTEISADIALSLVSEQTSLGLQVVGNFYVLTHIVPTDDLDESEIYFGLNMVARDADNLENALGKDNF
jgi:hypothetical protein